MTNWARIAYEFDRFPGSLGAFHFHLCNAIIRADKMNLEKLRKEYPELIKAMGR